MQSLKQFVKQSILQGVKFTGLNRAARYRSRRRLLGLCYHSVLSDGSPVNSRTNIAVFASEFEKQIALIRDRWNPVSLAEIRSACLENHSLPDYSVLVTFDDGFRNNVTLAGPILKKYEVPAVVFLTTGQIENKNLLWPQEIRERIIDGSVVPSQRKEREVVAETAIAACKKMSQKDRMAYLEELRKTTTLNFELPWKKELYEFMSWDEVCQIRQFGVDLGGHTVTHPILSSLNQESLRDELRLCKKKIESALGEVCFSFAYPNGGTVWTSMTPLLKKRNKQDPLPFFHSFFALCAGKIKKLFSKYR